LLPFIILAVVIGTSSAVAIINWDKIVFAIKGKKIAIIGARGVGKTTLFTFLSTGSIPSSYTQTTYSNKTDSIRYKLQDLELILKDSLDMSGSKSAYTEWKKTFLDADIVFYVFKISDVINNNSEAIERINEDMEHIKDWLNEREDKPRVFLIGTHCDLDPEYKNINSENMGDYSDRIYELQTVNNMFMSVGGRNNASLILGTLIDDDSAEEIILHVLKSYEYD
jgi:GTPase SAR1 family protein